MREKYLKLATAAEQFDLSIWTLRKWVRERIIPSYRFGRNIRVKAEDILNYAEYQGSISELTDEMFN